MPILNLKMDNVLSFHDFEIKFSYPQKLKKSLIESEYLKENPSFRYKKLNIFIGSNASGKTSLVKCIWKILLFIRDKEKSYLSNIINLENGESKIEFDFVQKEKEKSYLYRIKINTDNSNKENIKINVAYKKIILNSSSSYENLKSQLEEHEYVYRNYLEVLEEIKMNEGWNIVLPATEDVFDKIRFLTFDELNESEYLEIVNSVLKTLDPSIRSVTKSKDADNAFVIEHDCIGKIIVQEGNYLKSLDKLSSGTKYGFNIANIVYSIKNRMNGIYLIDEQFSYVNSDIEKAFISTMASLLGPNEQLFITTHNPEVLDLGFPFHSFNFMNKIKIDNQTYIQSYCASEIENRNNVSVKTILDNDVFGIAPNVNKIFELGE